jgi:hypothetical protein
MAAGDHHRIPPLRDEPAGRGSPCSHSARSQIGPRRAGLHRRHLAPVGMAERSPDIATVVSELLTNVLRHALPGPAIPSPAADPARPAPVRVLRAVRGRRPEQGGSGVADARFTRRDRPGTAYRLLICALGDRWGYTTPGETGEAVSALFGRRGHRRSRPGTRAGQAATDSGTSQLGRASLGEPSVADRPWQEHWALARDPHPQVTCG